MVWTVEEVEQRLVDALHLWARSPGERRWPFASDAPWHLMTRKTRVAIGVEGGLKGRELQLHMQAQDAEEAKRGPKPLPLSRGEVAMRDQASEWLGYVPERDRRLVVLALFDISLGRRVSWLRMRRRLDVALTGEALSYRYRKALEAIAKRLNASGVRVAA